MARRTELVRAPSGAGPAPGAARGLMKKVPKLFNTVTVGRLSANMLASIRAHPERINPATLAYPVKGAALPLHFDPRRPSGIPPEVVSSWFYKASDGSVNSILSVPLDQAGCGSCWAFAVSSMFTDTIRKALLDRYHERACIVSRFFEPLNACTGEAGVTAPVSGVVNADVKALYPVEVRNRISAYYTAAFAPKMRDRCPVVGFEDCTHDICGLAASKWAAAQYSKGRDPGNLRTLLGELATTCKGCEGNHIAMPLIMACGKKDNPKKGMLLISDFAVQDWACLFGDEGDARRFCTPEYLDPKLAGEQGPLFKADRYGYFTSDDLERGPAGITSMEEWFKADIFNYCSITIGYNVYESFMAFFSKNPFGVYTALDFLADIRARPEANVDPQGGHAVAVVGWGQEQLPFPAAAGAKEGGTRLVRFWIVRNSWGREWGDGGYFRIEREMDQALAAAGVRQRVNFESEFGSLYFAPYPNPTVYSSEEIDSAMDGYIFSPPADHCASLAELAVRSAREQGACRCPRGFAPDREGHCHRLPNAGASFYRPGDGPGRWSGRGGRLLVLLMILVVLAGLTLALRHPAVVGGAEGAASSGGCGAAPAAG